MKTVIQRVEQAQVTVEDKNIAKITKGILIFLCIENKDLPADADYLIDKITNLRIFEDNAGKMNLSIKDIKGELLVVSEFTLSGNCSKGRRPSFEKAANPKIAEELYEYFLKKLKTHPLKVEAGIFRAMMDVHIVNDGPVTFIIDSQKK